MLIQEVGFDIVSMWHQMGWLAKGVLFLVPVLALMTVVLVLRALTRKPSRQ